MKKPVMNFPRGLSQFLFLSAVLITLTTSAWGALGDNAPPVPATFKTAHPRLPYPDTGFLSSLAGNAAALADYNSTADQWDSTNPRSGWHLRRLVVAYLANKTVNPTKAATYLAKIKALADLGGTWGPLLYAVNDGVGNGTYTLKSASGNFLTGCNGASCAGNVLSIDGRTYFINSVPDANTVVVNSPRWRSGFAYDSTNDTILLYGGQDAAQVYNDTWVYSAAAGSWTKLTPGQAPPFDSVGPFENLAYDSDHNVFILVLRGTGGYADGGAVGHAMQTWMYRYQGAGSNAGTVEVSYQPAAGSVNVNSNAWAKDPALAVSGSALYSAWVETGKPFDTASASLFHVYAKQWNGTGAWTSLGGLPTSLDSEFNNQSESHSPSLTVVGGMPWISWYKWNNAGALWALWAKSWNGSSWQGGAVG